MADDIEARLTAVPEPTTSPRVATAMTGTWSGARCAAAAPAGCS